MIKYAIPGMYELQKTNIRLLELKRDHPEYFYDNVDIEIVYGNPQFCIFDGGRIFGRYHHATQEELIKLYHIYNEEFNIPFRYVFTSSLITEELCYDRFSNLLLELGNHYHNEIVCVSDILIDYVSKNYPTYKFVSSTTKCILDKEELKNELHRPEFKLVCLDYNFNKQIKFLETFTEDEIAKSELLINAICPPGCPWRKQHYYLNSMSHLNYGRSYKMEGCSIVEHSLHPDMKNHSNNLTYKEISEVYEPMGFEHFKIEGRTWSPLEAALTYVDYMIKPEWADIVILTLTRE